MTFQTSYGCLPLALCDGFLWYTEDEFALAYVFARSTTVWMKMYDLLCPLMQSLLAHIIQNNKNMVNISISVNISKSHGIWHTCAILVYFLQQRFLITTRLENNISSSCIGYSTGVCCRSNGIYPTSCSGKDASMPALCQCHSFLKVLSL